MTYWWEKPVLAVTGTIIEPFFALGAGLNQLTGGSSPTYNVWSAAKDSSGTTYSPVTQALSGYQGTTPGGGDWSLPILNPATVHVVHDVVKEVTGFDPKTLILIAAGLGAAVLASK